jgi:hypothetical protein
MIDCTVSTTFVSSFFGVDVVVVVMVGVIRDL